MNVDDIVFHEKQRFRQPWLWVLVVVPLVSIIPLMLFGIYEQLVAGRPFGDNPVSDRQLVLVTLLGIAVPLLILFLAWRAELDVRLTRDEIRARFRPFHRSDRVFPIAEVRSCEARDYAPIGEYGGWGIRMGGSRSWAYNVSGHRGVQLEFHDGRRLLLGSQRADELARAINAARAMQQRSESVT